MGNGLAPPVSWGGWVVLWRVRLLLDLVGPAVDAAELDDIGVAEVHERLRGLLAAIAAAAVYEDELVLVGQCVLGGGRHGVVRDEDGSGDVSFVVLGLRASVEDDVIVLGIHELLCGFGINLLVGVGVAAAVAVCVAVVTGRCAKAASEPGEGDNAREAYGIQECATVHVVPFSWACSISAYQEMSVT